MGPLWECMEKHPDYYAPQTAALKAGKELQQQQQQGSSSSEQHTASASPSPTSTTMRDPRPGAGTNDGQGEDLIAETLERWAQELDKEEESEGKFTSGGGKAGSKKS